TVNRSRSSVSRHLRFNFLRPPIDSSGQAPNSGKPRRPEKCACLRRSRAVVAERDNLTAWIEFPESPGQLAQGNQRRLRKSRDLPFPCLPDAEPLTRRPSPFEQLGQLRDRNFIVAWCVLPANPPERLGDDRVS